MPGFPTFTPSRPLLALGRFLDTSAGAGLLLMAAASAAVAVANSPAAPGYFALRETRLGGLTVLHWINDGLMALFFLLVGLEIKREFLVGQLSTWRKRALPGVAALGGMAVPAAIFLMLNLGPEGAPRGWAIPAATDIAFALGVLALLGSRVPLSLKVFLTALAIIDDLGAVAIIAMFYTVEIDKGAIAGAAIVLGLLYALNRARVTRLAPYLLGGAVLWVLVLRSGVHATLAGVALALLVPLRTGDEPGQAPLERLEHAMQPWIALAVVPVFGFFNAGLSLAGVGWATLIEPVSLGIAAGLFLGKQAGVVVFAFGAIRAGWAELPAGASWRQLYGVALLCGIGFTMSLFIGLLAFPADPRAEDLAKIGVIAGSLLSAAAGAAVLLGASRRPRLVSPPVIG